MIQTHINQPLRNRFFMNFLAIFFEIFSFFSFFSKKLFKIFKNFFEISFFFFEICVSKIKKQIPDRFENFQSLLIFSENSFLIYLSINH